MPFLASLHETSSSGLEICYHLTGITTHSVLYVLYTTFCMDTIVLCKRRCCEIDLPVSM